MAISGQRGNEQTGNGGSHFYKWPRFTATRPMDLRFGMHFLCTETKWALWYRKFRLFSVYTFKVQGGAGGRQPPLQWVVCRLFQGLGASVSLLWAGALDSLWCLDPPGASCLTAGQPAGRPASQHLASHSPPGTKINQKLQIEKTIPSSFDGDNENS